MTRAALGSCSMVAGLALALGPAWPVVLSAQIAVSANDAHVALIDGVNTPVRNAPPDTVTILNLDGPEPRVLGTVRAPASVIGPPQSVAIAPDRSIALVTASTKVDPADPTKTVPDDIVSVIDLQASPAAVIATLHAGAGAAGVSFNRAGTLALVANRSDGTLSVFTVRGKTVTRTGQVDLGAPASLPSHVVFTADGRMALVTRNNDDKISLLAVNGDRVTYTGRDIAAGSKPYGIEITPAGDVALAANIGAGGSGGTDNITVIDLSAAPPRVVAEVPVGSTLEGLSISADGRYAAVTVMNGSNARPGSAGYHDYGLLDVFSINGRTLARVAETRLGHWCQGVAWSRDSRTVVVQCMVEKSLSVFHFDGRSLVPSAPIPVAGGPAGIRAAP